MILQIMIVCKMQLIDLIWLFVEHFYQTDQQQQEMGGLEIQLKTALPMFIFGVMLMMMMMFLDFRGSF